MLCTPGQKLCDNRSVYLCGDAGTSRSVVTSCSALEVCDADAGACKPKLCDPGKLSCDATRVVTCNAAGTGYLQSGPDCSAKGGVCIAGACQPAACTPGQGFCKDNNAYSCSGDGTSAPLTHTCGPRAPCEVSGSSAYCDYYYCQPNALGCNDNVLSTCNVDGSDWLPGGTDCTLTNASCIDDKCSPNQCPPNALFCKNGNVQQCDGQGLTFSQAQFCAIGTYCATRAGSATCAPTPCSPDMDGCAGEKFGHCSSDGLGVGADAIDCGAAKQVCTLQGCAKTATDTSSAPMQLGTAGANEVIANVIDVDSARKLTQIEANLSMAAPRTLIWAVYVQTNANGQGEFDLEYQKSTSGSGSGFQSSGAINLALQPGKTYAIGVAASDGGFVYYYDTPPVPPSLNFAHVTGSIDSGFSPQIDYSPGTEPALYVTRLTTTTPAP